MTDLVREPSAKETARSVPAVASTLKHRKTPTSAAVPADFEANQNPEPALALLSTQDLRDRAASLVIQGWPSMERDELIQALADYHRQH